MLLLRPALGQVAEPPVKDIRELQAAAIAENSDGSQVALEGLVTWADPGAGKFFYLQDATGGIRVNYTGEQGPAWGDRLHVQGIARPGSFAPLMEATSYRPIGKARMPVAPYGSGGGLLNGSFNGEWVWTDGWIRTAEFIDKETLMVVLDSGASRISLRVSHASKLDPQKLIASKAIAYGVASPVRSREATGQLVEVQILVPRAEELHTDQREKISPWEKPYTPLRSVFRYQPGQTRGDRVHIRGEVLMTSGDIAWLHDGDAGLAIRGNTTGLKRGDRIDAVGFRDLQDFLPVFSDVIVKPDTGPAIKLSPKHLAPSELIDGLHHADHVAVSGHLLDRIETPFDSGKQHLVLALQSPRGVFTAELDAPYTKSMADAWETDSLLEVTGICVVQTDASGEPANFKILVPDAAGIRVVQAAPFFTVGRMLVLLCITLAILLAFAIAAYLLARRNTRLRSEVSERQAIAAERGRLARDLHDTLEQGLTGLQLHIRGITLSLPDEQQETRTRLETMRALVKQCRTEVRQSIWDLRAEALENFDLGDAIHRMAQSVFLGSGTRVEFHQRREGGKIPGMIGDNLLRIGQEAMTNALKHAQATLIEIELITTPVSASLSVSDDGLGLSNMPQDSRGHFGLVGMEERADRIGATLQVESREGGGTRVRVEVPLPPEETASPTS
ncbi:sensor histidine kinase [Luteolibacter soli]|uniref:Sensor histidine kinase n=1 Tax=Luteolibacter soli TaxID=3135280 RepID=A0ABU9APA7_9BACT